MEVSGAAPERIVLLRHGESEANVDPSIYERVPDYRIPLTARGVEQAREAGERLREQFGERTTTEFMIEYQLTDFLRLQATGAPETTNAGNRIGQRRIERAGMDVIFFFSY